VEKGCCEILAGEATMEAYRNHREEEMLGRIGRGLDPGSNLCNKLGRQKV
jgi:hypothetical protein